MRIGNDLTLLQPAHYKVAVEYAEVSIEGNTLGVINPNDGLFYSVDQAIAAGVNSGGGTVLGVLEDVDGTEVDEIAERATVTNLVMKLDAASALTAADIPGTPVYATGNAEFSLSDSGAQAGQIGVIYQRIEGDTSQAYVWIQMDN